MSNSQTDPLSRAVFEFLLDRQVRNQTASTLAWYRRCLGHRELSTVLGYLALVTDDLHRAPHAPYWEQRLAAAQRRYLRAIASLARLRKTQRPTLQVNIGHNQVNLAPNK